MVNLPVPRIVPHIKQFVRSRYANIATAQHPIHILTTLNVVAYKRFVQVFSGELFLPVQHILLAVRESTAVVLHHVLIPASPKIPCIPDRSPDFARIALVNTKLVQIFRLPYSVVNEIYGFTCHATIPKEEALNIPVRHLYLRHQKPVDERRRRIKHEFHLGWGYELRCHTKIGSHAYRTTEHVGVTVVISIDRWRQEWWYFPHAITSKIQHSES